MVGRGTGRLAWVGPVAAIVAFLATRVAFLDRDLPPWDLAQYQPIDESAYTIPAFNLLHYGTWTHQDVPWVPLEGSPMNVLQSLVTSWTLTLSQTYWGFRLPSVLFGLIAFLAMVAVVRRLVGVARADGVALPFPPGLIVTAAVLLLLADFSFLMGGRVVEATIPRLAETAVLVWLVARGSLLGDGHRGRGSFGIGLFVGAAVGFGYVYNAFLLPGALLAVAGWALGRTSRRELVRHIVLAGLGMAVALGVYFGWVWLVYGQGPAGWYDTWLALYRTAGRASTVDPTGLWDLLVGNIFRLDRPFMALVLLALPVFAWWTRRSRNSVGIVVLALAVAFAAQCTVQSDYPQRKMLILLAFAVPIVAGGLLRTSAFLDWARAGRRRMVAITAWALVVGLGTVVFILPPRLSHWTTLAHILGLPPSAQVAYRVGNTGLVVLIGAVVGLAALGALLAGWRRARLARGAGAVLLLAMLLPLAAVDARYVFTDVTTTYRDAMISVGALPDNAVIAGGSSHAMQLYDGSRAVLQGNVFGMTVSQYEAAVVRYFAEGRARWMFAYADQASLTRWTALGFRVVQTYPIPLPKDRIMGRYEYAGPISQAP